MIKSIHSKLYLKATILKRLCFLLSLSLFLASPTWAANWYVSQNGVGSKNGTSVNNAWAKTGIQWGSMRAGDTLYVVGVLQVTDFTIGTSGATNNYFTLSGYDSSSGIAIGFVYDYSQWTGPDAYGAYSLNYSYTYFGVSEWLTANGPLSYTKLNNAGKVPDGTWTEGSYYRDDNTNTLYWKPVGGTIQNKTVTVHVSSGIYFNGVSWVKATNLKTVGARWCIGNTSSASNIWLDHLTIEHTRQGTNWGAGVQIGLSKVTGGSDNIRISYSTISDGDSGIYAFSETTAQNNDNITIDHNTITDMASNADSHCIGFQGGSNNVIEYNDLSYCNTGITMFSFGGQETNNNTIKYNHVHHMEGTRAPDPTSEGYNRGYGIGWEGNVTNSSLRTGNSVYYNVVHDCSGNLPFGLNSKAVKGSSNYIYNNTVRNCTPSYRMSGNGSVGVGGTFKNNISLDPSGTSPLHWEDGLNNNGDYSGLTIDNNLYYPDGNKFYLAGTTYNFADWQNKLSSKNVMGAEKHSLISDPLFANSSGSYFTATDFQVQSTSPAINKGDNTVWSGKSNIFDFTGSTAITSNSGTIMAPGGVVDIGAYEKEEISVRPPTNVRVMP